MICTGKDAFWFSHDCNARNDPKVLTLRSAYGAEGYGLYFMILEVLREQPEYRLPVSRFLYQSLALQTGVPQGRVQEMVEFMTGDCADRGDTLLVCDGEYLYSGALLRRMGNVDMVSAVRSAAARRRWEKREK